MTIEDHISAALRTLGKDQSEVLETKVFDDEMGDVEVIMLKSKDWLIKIVPMFESFRLELIEYREDKDVLKRLIKYRYNGHGALRFQEIDLNIDPELLN